MFVDGQTDMDTVLFNLAAIIEGGLVEGGLYVNTGYKPYGGFIKCLTWDGMEFLDLIRSDDVWKLIRERVGVMPSVPFDTLKTIAFNAWGVVQSKRLGEENDYLYTDW